MNVNLFMTNIRDVLAKNMRAYRIALGFTQAQLAEKVNTSTHYIGMIETRNKFPSPEMLERIAAALEIDTIDLFTTEINLPETMKSYRKVAIKNLKRLLVQILDEKLSDLEKT
jgi:transcriptional regulator with XRE-family HTH domain